MDVRAYALDILTRVFQEDAYAGLLMRKKNDLKEADQRLASELVYGTLRNVSLLEYQWRPFVKKRVRTRTRCLLNLGVFQMFMMDRIPDYAAIDSSVALAKKEEKGFVNAVLHRVQKAGMAVPEDLSVRYSHPDWLIAMWKAHYGEETTRKILAADQKPKQMYGRLNTLKTDKEDAVKAYDLHMINDLSFPCDGSMLRSDLFRNHLAVIQDIHSAAVPAALEVKDGMNVLDACAAPGTKTQETACLMHNTGTITAMELHEHRTQLIRKLMEETGTDIVRAVTGDASAKGQFEEESFDRILLDVPCSGLGDLSHKPEIRWHVKPENLDEIAKTQRAILEANAPYLKKGGIMVYSTCTLNRKENSGMIQSFLRDHPEYTLNYEKTMFPFEDNGDGFYMAQLARAE